MKKVSTLFNLVITVSMILAFFVTSPMKATAQGVPTPGTPKPPLDGRLMDEALQFLKTSEARNVVDKIDPTLRELAQAAGSEKVFVYVSVKAGVDLSKFLTDIIERPEVIKGQHNVYGATTADKLMSIAQLNGVIAIVNAEVRLRDKPYDPESADKPAPNLAAKSARLQQLRGNELTYKEAAAKSGDVGASGWFDVLDGHKSRQAWDKGFTGKGVVVAVLDDGIDFAHPDLQGTYATVTDKDSPYLGWPMAFSQVSLRYFAYEVFLQPIGYVGISQGWNGSHWSDTQKTVNVPTCSGCTSGTLVYQPIGGASHTYTIPLTSESENYKIGTFQETYLEAEYGEKVAVLVVDETVAGEYDTAYVDLDGDFDFTDEKPVTKDSPEIFRDMDGDGLADISGGLLTWISDGANTPPGADWLWGIACGDEAGTLKACPDSGSLLTFTGPWDYDSAGSHGTLCASNVAGQGVISGGLSAQPFRLGGMVQGGAPEVGLMDFSNHYYNGTDEDEYIMAALGYDGIPMSGDEVQVLSNSYGNFTQMWGSWGYIGRLVTSLNVSVAPSTVWLFSGGNEGPGYGPQEGEAGPTILKVGTSSQYGSTNWDSISGLNQIVYGDPSSFGAKGPNRDGTSGLDILANGGRGSGDANLNYAGFNGADAFETWGGTSRSSPVAAGNLALLYQAYKARYGVWPTWDKVLSIAKSSATNSVSSPFLQGAGVINADRMTDVAAGVYGVYSDIDEWQVGDWEGEEYLNFAKVAWPNSSYSKTFTVTNPSGVPINLSLSDGIMKRFSEYEFEFTTSPSAQESAFNFHAPDYLIKMDPSKIPADSELMVVRYVHSYDTFDPDHKFSGSPDSSWRFLLYNWKDINGNGKLWTDRNGNGAVNHVDAPGYDNDGFLRPDFNSPGTEIEEGEYVRMDYEFGGIGIPIYVHNPKERMQDSYFFGLQRRRNTGVVDQTTFKIRVEFYKRADWPWLTLSTGSLAVPAESSATFKATMTLPANTMMGEYEGVIYMNDPGDALHTAHETAIPVVVNVINDLATTGAIHAGNGPREPTLYQNSWTNGYFNWYGGGWTGAGDWRHYFFKVDESQIPDVSDVIDQNLLIHTHWDDSFPTDFNTWVLGPTADCGSNGADPCPWWEDAGLDIMPIPEVFGPYTLQPIGSSGSFQAGAVYSFETSTGGPNDWLTVPLKNAGLHAIALHNVLYSGEDIEARFGVDVGTLSMEAELSATTPGRIFKKSIEARVFNDAGAINLQYTPTIEIPNLHATLAGGLTATTSDPMIANVPNNSGGAGGAYSPWLPDNVWKTIEVTTAGTTQLKVHIQPNATSDVDLFLVKDVNKNGIPESNIDKLVGSSGNAMGSAEEVTISNPTLDQYIVVFNGYDMDPASGSDVDWWWSYVAPGPVPSEETAIHSGPLNVAQDPSNPASSAVKIDFTTTVRSAGLHAKVTDIPAGNDVDLYLVDGGGNIIASSTNPDNADETLDWSKPDGEYRFGEGMKFTLWVHGKRVTGTISPTVEFVSDEVNMWLDQPVDADVSVSAIGAGETVGVTLEYAKTDMQVGDLLSARIIAGPSVLPEALSQIINIVKVNATDIPDVQVEAYKTIETQRSPTYPELYYNSTYGILLDAAAVYPGDLVTFVLGVTNIGSEAGWINMWDNWPNVYYDFVGFTGPQPPYWGKYTGDPVCGGATWECLDMYVYLNPGESVEYRFQVTKTSAMGSGAFSSFVNYNFIYYTDLGSVFEGLAVTGAVGFNAPFDEDLGQPSTGEMSYKGGPDQVAPGETFHYKLHLHNATSAATPTLYVNDPLPEEVAYVNATAPSGSVGYDSGTHTVTWSGSVPPQGLEIDVEVTADSDLPDGWWIYNEYSMAYPDAETEFAWHAKYTEVYDGMDPDLVVEKSVDKRTAGAGDNLSYSITVSNQGSQDAENALVHDVLPPHLGEPENLTATSGEAYYWEGKITWEGDLAVGASVTIGFDVKIDADAPSRFVLINPASATADNWSKEGFDSTVTLIAGPNQVLRLDLFQSQDEGTPKAWMPVTGYTVDGKLFYDVYLDRLPGFYYFTVDNLIPKWPLAEGYHPFYVHKKPLDWFTYWAGRGVVSGATGWQGVMWQIINGDAPIFYIKVSNVGGSPSYRLIDGLTYQIGGGDEYLRVDGAYLLGEYSFDGWLKDQFGDTSYFPVRINFKMNAFLPLIGRK